MADAAVTALLCEGVTCPQSAGLGGGFVLSIFIKEANKVETLIARTMAPFAASPNMFANMSTVTGALAVAVPGELRGLWELHVKYGKLQWAQLIDPIIELCRKGHVVSSYLARILQRERDAIMKSPSLRAVYVDPKTGDVYKEGDYVKRHDLANTFEIIQIEGVNSLYGDGTLRKRFLKDIEEIGGIITKDDFTHYRARWEQPIVTKLKSNKTIYSAPLPASGSMVAFMMNVLDGFIINRLTPTYQRIAEAFKYAYGERTELGDSHYVQNALEVQRNLSDPAFAEEKRRQISDFETHNDYGHYGANFAAKDDHGTVHINILAANGDAISATSTINTL